MTNETIISVLVSYLIGSIPFAFLLAKWRGRVDLRTVGSKNVGARNLARQFGWGWGAFGALLDILKGALAIFIAGNLIFQNPPGLYYAGAAAVAGHNWPIFLKFHGGKGLATAAGVVLALAPNSAMAGALGALLFLAIFKKPIQAGLFGFFAAASSVPLFGYAQDIVWLTLFLFALALAAIAIERLTKRRDPSVK